MKLNEIPGLMDWIKTLPQQWLDDPESWTMENFYIINSKGSVAPLLKITDGPIMIRAFVETKEQLARMITAIGKKSGAAAVVQACEGWIMKFKEPDAKLTNDQIMEAYGPGEAAEKARQRLGIERVHALTIMAQTNEETLMMSVRAYEHPKALGEVLQEAKVSNDAEGTFANLLK